MPSADLPVRIRRRRSMASLQNDDFLHLTLVSKRRRQLAITALHKNLSALSK
jgi:hypothetical protein